MNRVGPEYNNLPRTEEPTEKVKYLFNAGDWFFIGSALTSASAVSVIFLKIAGKTSFAKPFSVCLISSFVMGLLGEIYKDRKIDVTSFVDAFIPKPIFDPSPCSEEGTASRFNGTGVVSLINRGTDCFMNATFQVIMHDQLLREALVKSYEKDKSPKAVALHRAMNLYSSNQKASTFNLRQFMPENHRFGQQDAYEFLLKLLEDVDHNSYPDLFPIQTTTYFWEQKDEFDVVIKNKQTQEPEGEFNSIIQIPIQKELVSGQELIDDHFQKKKHEGEPLSDGNDLYFPGQLQVQFDTNAKRLVFVLKRFDQNNKIMTPVDMPEELVVNQKNYSLKKVIVHQGTSMGCGHYIALLQIKGQWIYASDDDIFVATNPMSDRQNGYIYFYELEELVK